MSQQGWGPLLQVWPREPHTVGPRTQRAPGNLPDITVRPALDPSGPEVPGGPASVCAARPAVDSLREPPPQAQGQGCVLLMSQRWVQVGETATLLPEVSPLHARQNTGRQPATAQWQGPGTHPPT